MRNILILMITAFILDNTFLEDKASFFSTALYATTGDTDYDSDVDGPEDYDDSDANAKAFESVDDIDAKNRTKLKAPLYDLFQTTEWGLFLQEFEIKWELGYCGKGLDFAAGFKAHMIEPIGYMETTKRPLNFPFAELDLGGNIIKSCSSRSSSTEESTRDECYYNHFVFAPIMGMIFKKKLKFVCFHQGTILLPLISEFDPTHLVDVYNYKMIPHIIAMISPQAIVTSVINCGATMAYSMIKGYATNVKGDATNTWDETEFAPQWEDPDLPVTEHADNNSFKTKGLEGLAFIRNTMYYNIGCVGMHPVGGYSRGIDPGVDNVMQGYAAMSKLHGASALTTIPLLQKQTEFGMEILGGVANDKMPGSTMCKAKNFAMPIETQYINQRAFPTVSTAKETGEPGATSTTLANVPGSKDSFVNVYWQRRDFYAFAYFCTDKVPGEQ